MSALDKKHFDAAGEMLKVFASRLGQNGTLHSETVIAAAARMAGTMLFRSFGLDTSKVPPGTAVLSNEANEKGPELLNIVGGMLTKYGLQPDKEKLARVDDRGEPPKLAVLEMQEVLEDDLTAVRAKYGLSLEDGARACALATARLIREGGPEIGLEVGFHIAAYGFIEGAKPCRAIPIPQCHGNRDRFGVAYGNNAQQDAGANPGWRVQFRCRGSHSLVPGGSAWSLCGVTVANESMMHRGGPIWLLPRCSPHLLLRRGGVSICSSL